MVMSGLAPTEKSEHLVYTILPVSFSLCVVAFLATSVEQYVSIIAIITPILTIILYEIGPDDWWVKSKYREKLLLNRDLLNQSYVAVHLLIQSWDSTVEDIPLSKIVDTHVEDKVNQYINGTLSGYIARRRFWRIRSTIFLYWSIPFIITAGLVYLFRISILTFDIAFVLFIVLVITTETSVYWPNKTRNIELVEFLKSMATFSFWQVIVTADRVRNPAAYDSGIKRAFRMELDSIESLLFKGDWINFRLRWNLTHNNMLSNIEDDLEKKFWDIFFDLWGKAKFYAIQELQPEIHEKRLNWFVLLNYWYGKYYPKYVQETNTYVDSYKKASSFAYPSPNYLLEKIPIDLVLYGDSKANSIVKGLCTMMIGSVCNFEHLVKKFINAIGGGTPSYSEIEMDPKKLANYSFDYAIRMDIRILRDIGYVEFKSIYDKLDNTSDKQRILQKYIAFVDAPDILLMLLRDLNSSEDIVTPETISLMDRKIEDQREHNDYHLLVSELRRIVDNTKKKTIDKS